MKQAISISIFFSIFISCAQVETFTIPSGWDTTAIYSNILERAIPDSSATDFLTSYASLRKHIESKRLELNLQYMKATTQDAKNVCLDSASRYLQMALVENVFPYWYGTAWDFNGISDKPQRGYVACGYFVSTTLKHCGIELNRYKVAQQYSHSIVNTLCSDVKKYTALNALLDYIASQPDNVYVVGLDNHVGFISKQNEAITFIHSSFVGPACVESEQAKESPVLASSRFYVLGNATGNKNLLLHWLQRSPVAIVP
ncbi:hypothetical protein [Cytophaga aurantiaca]|uniref:hypothetical protein n=1 Tax=Cytophaga aurantiaca TaxID=29530 RepID=UPI0003A0B380|nr:hypothetical protein [Cytophaga aurantiaca]